MEILNSSLRIAQDKHENHKESLNDMIKVWLPRTGEIREIHRCSRFASNAPPEIKLTLDILILLEVVAFQLKLDKVLKEKRQSIEKIDKKIMPSIFGDGVQIKILDKWKVDFENIAGQLISSCCVDGDPNIKFLSFTLDKLHALELNFEIFCKESKILLDANEKMAKLIPFQWPSEKSCATWVEKYG